MGRVRLQLPDHVQSGHGRNPNNPRVFERRRSRVCRALSPPRSSSAGHHLRTASTPVPHCQLRGRCVQSPLCPGQRFARLLEARHCASSDEWGQCERRLPGDDVFLNAMVVCEFLLPMFLSGPFEIKITLLICWGDDIVYFYSLQLCDVLGRKKPRKVSSILYYNEVPILPTNLRHLRVSNSIFLVTFEENLG